MPSREISMEERETLARGLARGLTYAQLARALGRTRNGCRATSNGTKRRTASTAPMRPRRAPSRAASTPAGRRSSANAGCAGGCSTACASNAGRRSRSPDTCRWLIPRPTGAVDLARSDLSISGGGGADGPGLPALCATRGSAAPLRSTRHVPVYSQRAEY